MKRFIVLSVFALAGLPLSGQGMDFFHGTWEETLAEAQKRGVVIFVDAYTTWCGPCKRMAAQVFPLKEVGDFYNANFVNTKIDMESKAGTQFKRKYPVRSYPTFLFIAPDGEVVLQAIGAKPAEQFIALGEEALKKYDGSAKYQVLYDEGDKSYETVYNLVQALNKADKSSLRVANDYLKTQDNLGTPDNLRLILEAFTQVDSKMYEYVLTYQKDIIKLVGEDAVNDRIRAAARKTASRATEYQSKALLGESITAMEKHLPKEADVFEMEASMQFAASVYDAETYFRHAKQYLRKTSDDDATRLHEMAQTIIKQFGEHDELLDLGEKAAKMAVDLKDIERYNVTYATVVYLRGDKERAGKITEQAIERLTADGQKVNALENLKKKLGVS
jgi:thiol-disulfide isomerase/thioredoxin